MPIAAVPSIFGVVVVFATVLSCCVNVNSCVPSEFLAVKVVPLRVMLATLPVLGVKYPFRMPMKWLRPEPSMYLPMSYAPIGCAFAHNAFMSSVVSVYSSGTE